MPNRDVVTVRWLVPDTIDASRWPALRAVLDADECARVDRLYFERDRKAYIAAHALARVTLSRCVERPPEAWRFVAGAHGKPQDDTGTLRFNLSHTRGLVAVVVAQAVDLGVDVERVDPQRLGPELTDRVFTSAECAHLHTIPKSARTDAAYAFWTLREAYIKAIGLGLACPLDAFHFNLDPLSIHFSSRLADDPAQWLFRLWRPTPDHVMALGVRHPDSDRIRLDARAVRDDELPG